MTKPTKALARTGTVPKSAKRPQPIGGSRKGIPNKVTTEIKTLVVEALSALGGVDYLVDKAESHPAAFLALVGKTLPLQVTGKDGGEIQFAKIVRVIVEPGQ